MKLAHIPSGANAAIPELQMEEFVKDMDMLICNTERHSPDTRLLFCFKVPFMQKF
jgi:hypothetical protein